MKNMCAHSTHAFIAKFLSRPKDWSSQTAFLLMVALTISLLVPSAAHGQTKKKAAGGGAARKRKITITYPESNVTASGGFIDLEYKADNEELEAFKVKVTTETDGYSGPVLTKSVRLFLYKGKNTIKLTGYKDGAPVAGASAEIAATCNRGCIDDLYPLGGPIHPIGRATGENVEQQPSKPGDGGSTGPRNISIRVPTDAPIDASTIDSTIVLQEKSGIKNVFVQVYNNGQLIDKGSSHKVDYQDGLGIVPVKLKLSSGTNSIQAFDPSHIGDVGFSEVAQVNCAGEKCKSGAATDTPAKKNITILQPPAGLTVHDVPAIDLYLNILKGSNIKHLVSEVYDKDGKRLAVNPPIKVDDSAAKDVPITPRVTIVKGDNTIRFLDPDHAGDANYEASVKVTCSDKCSDSAAAPGATPSTSAITIDQPKLKADETVDTPIIDAYLTIAPDTDTSKIEKLKYSVFNGETVVFTSDAIDVKSAEKDPRKKRVEVKILKGKNTITFFDPADPKNEAHKASFDIECQGDHCPLNFDIAKFPSNSLNSRVVVGIEQAGASSAESKSKPFIDFFFTTPFLFSKDKCEKKNPDGTPNETYPQCIEERDREVRVPRAGIWGQVRIASSPAQIANAEILPSSLVNQVSNPANVVELVQSFDFLAGVEVRLKTSNGNFLSLIPGLRQRTSLYVAGGAGAISPLESTKQAVQIFKIPGDTDPQRAEFERRYGKPPAGANNVAFLPLDRDRFFRQWYAGVRLKTHYCQNYSCSQYINSFPAMVDFMVGQNESVTGGSLFYYKQTDPNDPSKLEKKKAWVFRIDAFYPFPIKEANFLYFYGSAMLKFSGGGVSVQNPLFLDRVDSAKLSDTDLYIPTVDVQKLRLPNRDYYKIGVGINLTELFNRNKGVRP